MLFYEELRETTVLLQDWYLQHIFHYVHNISSWVKSSTLPEYFYFSTDIHPVLLFLTRNNGQQ